jgi:multidrug efflux pump subunit AcrA (membrane-fusion protein)
MAAALDDAVQIEELRAQLQSRLAQIEGQIQPLQAEAAKLRTQLDLVTKLLHVTKADGTILEPSQPVSTSASVAPGKAVADNVAEILVNAGQPLHVSEIHARYLRTGQPIPGKGTEANLLVYMVRDRRFTRVAKGTYALGNSATTIAKAPVKRRGRRRRS